MYLNHLLFFLLVKEKLKFLSWVTILHFNFLKHLYQWYVIFDMCFSIDSVNGDMIPDLLGENIQGVRHYWTFQWVFLLSLQKGIYMVMVLICLYILFLLFFLVKMLRIIQHNQSLVVSQHSHTLLQGHLLTLTATWLQVSIISYCINLKFYWGSHLGIISNALQLAKIVYH